MGVPLRGAARSRTLQGGTEVTSVDFGTLRRYHGLWVWLETGTRGLARFRSGRFGDTIRLGRSAWWSVGRNTLVGLLHVGTLRRYHGLWEGKCLAYGCRRYRSGRFAIPCGGPGSGRVAKGWDASTTPNGTIVLVHLATSSRGRFDVTIRGRNPNPGCRAMSVLASTCRVSLVIVRGVDFISSGVPLHTKHAAQAGIYACGSRRSRCGVKGRCGVYGLQGRSGSGSPEAQCINGCVRGTGRHCEEAGGDRQGSPISRLPCVRRPTRKV